MDKPQISRGRYQDELITTGCIGPVESCIERIRMMYLRTPRDEFRNLHDLRAKETQVSLGQAIYETKP